MITITVLFICCCIHGCKVIFTLSITIITTVTDQTFVIFIQMSARRCRACLQYRVENNRHCS
jgi:hypothetical protein